MSLPLDITSLNDTVLKYLHQNSSITTLLILLVSFIVLRSLLAILGFVWVIVVGKKLNVKKYITNDSWAVVTGSTDGIGLEFARQLSQLGSNILLIARNGDKLSGVAREIEIAAKHGVKVKTCALDFSDNTAGSSEEFRSKLETAMNGLDISILVNNVGRSHTMPVPFSQTPFEEIQSILNINVLNTVLITRIVIDKMQQRSRSSKSLILNIGSFAGFIPTPLLTTYSASKAFLVHFTRALNAELSSSSSSPIDVKLLNTFYVVSNMSKIRRPSLTTPTPSNYVRAALTRDAGVVGAPFRMHRIIERILGDVVGVRDGGLVIGKTLGINEGIRKRALRKVEREKGGKME